LIESNQPNPRAGSVGCNPDLHLFVFGEPRQEESSTSIKSAGSVGEIANDEPSLQRPQDHVFIEFEFKGQNWHFD
jgi:hypothetical protein